MKALICSILVFTFLGCIEDYEFTYETIVGETPVNLEGLNSTHDDYNSTLPYEAFRHGLYFSTNRNSGGNNYDIIYKDMDISYHSRDDILNISFVAPSNTFDRWLETLQEINTEHDELGPYTYWGESNYEYFFYANDKSGDFDIKYLSAEKGNQEENNSPESVSNLNSVYDDIYPSIIGDKMYFCSNRVNNIFDIYSTSFIENMIDSGSVEVIASKITKNTLLSSSKNDKCPYILDDYMVFASDREGGYGGFDLYYSKLENGNWSEPINLGDTVNTADDEYRPIILPFLDFEETMIIFSSDREGGKGGFDLYGVRTALL